MTEQQLTPTTPTKSRFAPTDVSIGVVEKEEIYHDGFTFEERETILKAFREIDKRDKEKFPLTLEDQIVIIKHFRIKRTQTFVLNPPKAVKVKAEKVPKAGKVAKVKKLTKKDQTRLDTMKYLLNEEILSLDTMKPADKLFWETNKFRFNEEVENV